MRKKTKNKNRYGGFGLQVLMLLFLLLVGANGAYAQGTFSFTVTDNSGNTYSGTAKAKLIEGDYVVATGLKLTQNE